MSSTKIEWTDVSWNPVTGCTKVSSGCQNCYAEIMAKRLKAMGVKKYEKGFSLTLHDQCVLEPLKWKRPCNVFVCSMSDLFHERVPYTFIDLVMNTIKQTPQHQYQILTKRAERMHQYFSERKVPDNAWLGVTVEDVSSKYRIDLLKKSNAKIRFLSCEPLLENLGSLNLEGIHWVIVGGESGPKARPMEPAWASSIKKQAEENRVAFFFKQWGTWGSDGVRRNKKANGKLIDGKVCQQMPLVIESDEIPKVDF